MACQERRERFDHAMIDCGDMTISEYTDAGVSIYNIMDILRRWEGVPDIVLTIERRVAIPPTEER